MRTVRVRNIHYFALCIGLVLMQPINYFAAYYYTGASVKGEQLWSCAKGVPVFQEVSIRGFFLQCVVSDMGGSNPAMWKCAGVVSNRYS